MSERERRGVMSREEQEIVLCKWNTTEAVYPHRRCIQEFFEAQVARDPAVIAVTDESGSLTYGQLNCRANQLARHLRKIGVRPDERVAICMERSLEMVVALLAVLKAGGAYVPLDPSYPTGRLAYMLTDSSSMAILTNSAAVEVLSATVRDVPKAPPILDVKQDEAVWAQESGTDISAQDIGLSSEHLVYVIYTSGSTGVPKGVMTEHRALVNRLCWMQDAYRLAGTDAVLQKTPFSFDVSVWEFLWTLMSGARLVMARPQGHKDPIYLRRIIQEERITTVHFVPSMLQLFLTSLGTMDCRSLRRVVCSGEALPAALLRRFSGLLPDARLYNLYGPTEAAIDVTAWDWTETNLALNSVPPIGRPIWNTRIYILDEAGQPVPPGREGEIHIGGAGVARGYLNRPELTAERFAASPFVRGDRLYKTGDLGRFLPDGNIEYLGRNDYQVKINGCRIELGEIEARLSEHPRVREAVVLAREDRSGDKRLIAYYTSTDGDNIPAKELHERLSAVLAQFMLPSAYVRLLQLPLSVNGKLDRSALPVPDARTYDWRLAERQAQAAL